MKTTAINFHIYVEFPYLSYCYSLDMVVFPKGSCVRSLLPTVESSGKSLEALPLERINTVFMGPKLVPARVSVKVIQSDP
jgi:hypothetical protein